MSVVQERLVAGIAATVLALLAGCGGQTATVTTTTALTCPESVTSIGGQPCSKESIEAPKTDQEIPKLAPEQAARVLTMPALTASANGQLPSSELAPATGCSRGLAKSAAAAWNHVAVIVHDHTGYWLQSNGDASCYRTYQQQVDLRNYWCGLGNCTNAAVPGTSNHGWGLAVDAPPATVSAIHSYSSGLFGQGYGSCSDAPWESWHIKYCGGYSGPDPGAYGSGGGGGFHVLKRGSHGSRVQKLQTHLFYLHDSHASNGYLVKWSFRTGFYGPHTAYAVHKLQHDGGLSVDGKYGPKTAAYQHNRWERFCKTHHAKPC